MSPSPSHKSPTPLSRLTEQIRAIETRSGQGKRAASPVASAWGGLSRSVMHEWLGPDTGQRWQPPLCLLTDLAWRSLQDHGGWVFWMGRRCWPHVRVLVRGSDRTLLKRSVFLDLPRRGRDENLWALDLVLRSPAAAAVVADGRGLEVPASRRLQLAAESGQALALMARPVDEKNKPSAAGCRWGVSRLPAADSAAPRWRIALWRCKGVQPELAGKPEQKHWDVEWHSATGLVHLPADVVGRSGSPTLEAPRRTARSVDHPADHAPCLA